MIRKNLIKSLSVIMAAMLAVMTVACGQTTTDTAATAVETAIENQKEKVIEDTMVTAAGLDANSSEAGKVETVYVTADANGAVNDVIVSEWLKNATASTELADSSELKNIVNVKGEETFKDNGDGTLTWDAEGSDIYYQGTTDKELPVTMKITYTLNGKEISPEELAGKSGRVTMRFEYQNNAKQTVNVKGKDIEVYTPFAMVSGMMLDAEKFANVEITNGKVISDGGNYVVMGVATPGLKESLDISDEKWDELEDADEIKEKLSNSFEITADTTDFELGMTITMASSDILSDFGLSDLSDSDKIEDVKDDMGKLEDGANQLVDGTKTLKDGTTELRDGTGRLFDGTTELEDGARKLYSGATELSDGTAKLYDGTGTLADGTGSLADGTAKLYAGVKAYTDGASQINAGAAKLGNGISQVQSGSNALMDTMNKNNLTDNAKAIMAGAEDLNKTINTLASLEDKMSELADMTKTMAELGQMKVVVTAAQEYLLGSRSYDDNVKAGLYVLSQGQLTTQADAEALVYGANATSRGASGISSGVKSLSDGLNALNSALPGSTVTVTQPDNYEENVVEVETGTLENNSGDDEGDKETEQATEASTEQTVQAPAAEQNTNDETAAGNGAGAGTEAAVETEGVSDEEVSGGSQLFGAGDTEGNVVLTQEQYNALLECQKFYNNYAGLVSKMPEIKKSVGELASGAADLNEKTASLSDGVTAVATYNQLLGASKGTLKAIADIEAKLGNIDVSVFADMNLQDSVSDLQRFANGSYALANGVLGIYDANAKINAGLGQVNQGAGDLVKGTKTLTSKNGELVDGAAQLNDGAGKLNDGAKELKDGAGKLNDGAHELNDGAGKLADGATELKDGAGQLNDGVITLDDGVKELLDGVIKLDEEGISKLYEVFDGDLTEFADRMTAIQEAGNNYKSFGGSSDDVDSSVKFIIKTDSIKQL